MGQPFNKALAVIVLLILINLTVIPTVWRMNRKTPKCANPTVQFTKLADGHILIDKVTCPKG